MSKFVSGVDPERVSTWEMPELERSASVASGFEIAMPSGTQARMLSAEDLEMVRKRAYQESYEQGYSQGLQAAKVEVERELASIREVLGALSRPLEELDRSLEENLLALTLAVAQQVVRREIQADPAQIIAVIRQAMDILPAAAARDVTVFVHPDDARILSELESGEDGAAGGWQIKPAPELTRGGCKVVTDEAAVDATVEGRIGKIAAQLLGGERIGDPVIIDNG